MEISLLENPVRDGFALVNIALFLAVGVWLLHRRFALLEELTPRAQAVVVCWAALTCGVELIVLRGTLQRAPVLYIFTAIGFFVAAFALYGHIGVSLLSKLLVDVVWNPGDDGVEHPRTGSAEALERTGDSEGAAREYLALARIYPRDPGLWIRAGDNFARLERRHDAAACFERAMMLVHSPEDALLVFRRCTDVLRTEEDGETRCAALAGAFIQRFTGSHEADSVTKWLATRGRKNGFPVEQPSEKGESRQGAVSAGDSGLERLEDHPLGENGRE